MQKWMDICTYDIIWNLEGVSSSDEDIEEKIITHFYRIKQNSMCHLETMYIKVTITWRHEGDQEIWSKVYRKACNKEKGHKVGSNPSMEMEVVEEIPANLKFCRSRMKNSWCAHSRMVTSTFVILATFEIYYKEGAR